MSLKTETSLNLAVMNLASECLYGIPLLRRVSIEMGAVVVILMRIVAGGASVWTVDVTSQGSPITADFFLLSNGSLSFRKRMFSN